MAASNHRPVLIVIAGPHGSGKTSVTSKILHHISRYDKSIANCKILSAIVDRLYIYDNSIEDAEARLLFRLSDGELAKRYIKELPDWASAILPR